MDAKPYLMVTCVIFAAVGVAHLVRLVNQTQIMCGPRQVPMSLSVIGLPIAWGLAAWALRLWRAR